jgi:hypothetical protein
MEKIDFKTKKEIEEHYDQVVINSLLPLLTQGKGGEFVEKIAELKKQKDNDLLVKAREIPPLAAPKAVGLTGHALDSIQRQGVN